MTVAQSLPVLLIRAAFLSPSAWKLLLASPALWRIGLFLAGLAGACGVLGLSIGRNLATGTFIVNLVIGTGLSLAGCIVVALAAHLIINRLGSGRGKLGSMLGAVGCAHAVGILMLAMALPAWTFGVWAVVAVWTLMVAAGGVANAARASLSVSLLAVIAPYVLWAVLQLTIWALLAIPATA